jgi:hypothetical protein
MKNIAFLTFITGMLFNTIFGSTRGLFAIAKRPPRDAIRLSMLEKFAADMDASEKITLAQEKNQIVDTRTFDNYDLISPRLMIKARKHNAKVSPFNPRNKKKK